MRTLFLFLTVSFISASAWAEAMYDFGFAYSSDSLTTATSNTNAQTFYNLGVLFNIDKKARWNMGLAVMGLNQTSSVGSTNTTYGTLDFGPAFRWNIDKDGIFSVSAVYGYVAKGTYSSGATNETWNGTSFFTQFAVLAPIAGDFYLGMSLNMYSGSYPTKVVSSVESTNTGAKSWIFPMISLSWHP